MPTQSKIVSDKDIIDMRNHITELIELKREIKLANDAGIQLQYTQKDIDDQITSLEAIIRAYSAK